jgi:predicted RNase H-like nuclease (RuvC/YqgF family)
MDRNYPNFFEDCFGHSTQLMYVPAVMKTYQFWLENRQRSLFPRTTITIPTAAVNPVLPAPIINREDNLVATLRDRLTAVTTQRDNYRRQRNASRTLRSLLTKERDDLKAKLAAVTAERDQAIAAQRTRDPSTDRESQRHSQAISQLRQENVRLQTTVQDLQRQLEDLQNKNGEQDGIRKNVTQE